LEKIIEQIREVNDVRNTFTPLFLTSLVLIVSFGALNGVRAQAKQASSPDLPVRNEIRRQYQLAPNTTVKISMIAGPVEIDTTTGELAEINIVNSAETQADLNCSDIPIEQTPGKLVIHSKSLCNIVRVNQRVMLKLPRKVNLDLEYIAGHVRIGPTEGMVRLNGIAGHVSTGFLQAAEMSSLASGLSMEINQIGERGIRLSSITGGIELGLSDNLNAQFVADSIVGNVISDIADIKIITDGESDYQAQIGSGGQKITISSVRGGIRIRKLSIYPLSLSTIKMFCWLKALVTLISRKRSRPIWLARQTIHETTRNSTNTSCWDHPAAVHSRSGRLRRGCQRVGLVGVRETGLISANMLRAFQVGKALTSDEGPSSWMRSSRVAWAQVSWPACHLTKASASAVM
jgi:hypothetical protein